MTRLYMTRAYKSNDGLSSTDTATVEKIGEIKFGDVVEVTIKRRRNIKHHRKYWALIHLLHHNQDQYATQEDLSNAIKVALGHCYMTKRTLPDGTEMHIATPRSISFAKMDQTAFDAFYTGVIRVVCNNILPHMEGSGLRNEIEEMTL